MWGWVFDETEQVEIDTIRFPGTNEYSKQSIDLAYVEDIKMFEKEFKGSTKQLCINDTEFSNSDFGYHSQRILEKLFPKKSQFKK